ncbi:MAG: hypothetical protein NTW62_01210 [Candidatus Nomurabacteria bacterium]|nr:hypothetical protein [Candidatus Nomurabacteria bacterium]
MKHEITTKYSAVHIFYEGGSSTLDEYSIPWFSKLDESEVKTFCSSARSNGKAELEDKYSNNLSLVYNDDSTYTLKLRD